MTEDTHDRIYRRDYEPSGFLVDAVDLGFELDPVQTVVKAKMQVRRNPDLPKSRGPLRLHGDELQLRALRLDGSPLDPGRFEADSQSLQIADVPERFELETEVLIHPAENTKLMGLYTSSDAFCTQCEAEGFRRITYYLDRPDVMARFTTRIEADRAKYPILLSNGNRVGEGELRGGRHWVQWEDPFPKPSYLFALVAGDLVCHRGTFRTASGRDVALEIWVEAENADKCEHALASLQAAMKWDEDTYGLEYDLDIYMIVAVNDFNMGAMENKGLNIFNSKYVLAKPSTATDDDYEGIESVVSHEYFHNWTGNRVTCRDWFQLTLKEGLTVFRDQEFSADMTSRAVQRVKDVTRLRTAQFAEDAGPLAHPIRPESYIEMNNFYTATVYEKGAEVVRLYQTLLGREGFR
ncbi:MAG: aminopeptidase N, partial [Deltaproteobacteria bacterium]|nr:aminopeptidase N [Deltaproteobacteria bacterium]